MRTHSHPVRVDSECQCLYNTARRNQAGTETTVQCMELASNGGAGMEEVSDFLQECRLGHLLPHLEQLGVGCLHDLVDVNEENLEGAGEAVACRLWRQPDSQASKLLVGVSLHGISLVPRLMDN